MDVHGKSLDVVSCDVLKRFNKQEIESVVGVEISDGAVLLADNGDLYVWPEKDAIISGESFKVAISFEFGLEITKKFKKPYYDLQLLGLYLSSVHKPLTIHLDVLDPVLRQFGMLNINYMWEYVYYTYQQVDSWGVMFSSALHHKVSPGAYRYCGLNDSLVEYWNRCYKHSLKPEVSLLVELGFHTGAELFNSYLSFNIRFERFSFACWNHHENSVWIENCEFKCKDHTTFHVLNMEADDAESFVKQLLEKKEKYKLTFTSEKDKLFCEQPNGRYVCSNTHHWAVWRRKTRHKVLVDICMALSFLNMPYVVNDIVLWLDEFAHISQYERIEIIEPVFASLRKVWQTREQTAKEIKTA